MIGLAALPASVPRDPAALRGWLAAVDLDVEDVVRACVVDPSHPYGRNVVVSAAQLEVMVATWTAGAACAPHDHGGAEGAVRIVQGRCVHRVYAPEGAVLREVSSAEHRAGDVLFADRDLVHAMQDAGDPARGELPLVTLHVYVPGIRDMVVYDVPGARTLVVAPDCGAWVPDPAQVRRAIEGFVPPDRSVDRG